jgi:hypothetical protein
VSSKPARSYPPIIRTSDPDSFAAFTFRRRLPAMLDQIIEKNGLAEPEAAELRELKERLHSGTVHHSLSAHPYLADQMDAVEHATWSREIEKNIGRPWLDLPWYFAESLFYLEVLLAWGYYRENSPRFAVDPFQPFKEEELQRPGGALDLAARIAAETGRITSPLDELPVLLRYGLWANRLDLSYSQLLERYRDSPDGESNQLLLDHSEAVTEKLLQAGRVDLILDNSGSELIADLKLQLGRSDLVVLKGDLNYRRLLADRRWDPATPMEAIVGYFPTALVTLRTTKSELITDLQRETVERLNRDDPKWLVEGRYGIIRYCDPRAAQAACGTR